MNTLIDILSIEDLEFINEKYKDQTYSPKKKNIFSNISHNSLFREYEKTNDDSTTFIATDKYYIADTNNTNNIDYFGFNFSKSYSYNGGKCVKNIYLPYQNNFLEIISKCDNEFFISKSPNGRINKDFKFIDLVVIDNISFTLDDIKINKRDLLRKIIANDQLINDKLLEKLYMPGKLQSDDVQNKFLFKIDFTENYVYKKNILFI